MIERMDCVKTVLELRNIKKIFGGTTVLDDINISFLQGEFHALVGENGAGKSTIIKIISGVYQADGGKVYLDDKEARYHTPSDAQKAGISTLFQEIQEIPEMTVAENIFLGREPVIPNMLLVDKKKLMKDAKQLVEDLGLKISTTAKMRDLPVSTRKMVEIARAVSQQAKVVIMDEPTANLNAEEINVLFKMIDKLKEKQTTIIYISHRMNEVFSLADRVTVLRDGKKIATMNNDEYDEKSLISMMIGRELTEMYPTRNSSIGRPVLEVEELSLDCYFENATFDVKSGEVVGLAGLDSSGATAITKTLFGLCGKPEGYAACDCMELQLKNPHTSIKQKIAYLPEDRKTQGLFLNQSLLYNYTISSLSHVFSKKYIVKSRMEKKKAFEISHTLKLKANDLYEKANQLSGGNQQKIMLGRWMLDEYKVLILEEPTRGVDVGAKAEIYRQINLLAEKGLAVLMYSTDMMELIGMCDRILVFSAGKLTASLSKEEASQEKIMQYALVR